MIVNRVSRVSPFPLTIFVPDQEETSPPPLVNSKAIDSLSDRVIERTLEIPSAFVSSSYRRRERERKVSNGLDFVFPLFSAPRRRNRLITARCSRRKRRRARARIVEASIVGTQRFESKSGSRGAESRKGIRRGEERERERILVASSSIHASFEPEKPEEQIDLTILFQRV